MSEDESLHHEHAEPPQHIDLQPPPNIIRDKWNRPPIPRFEKLHLTLGIAGVVLAIPPFLFYLSVTLGGMSKEQAEWPIALIYLTQNGVLILLLAVFGARFYSQYRIWRRDYARLEIRSLRTLALFAKRFHTLAHLKRDLLSNPSQEPRRVDASKAVDTLVSYCQEIKEALQYVHNDRGFRFNVTVKALHSQADDEFNVTTIARDREKTQADSHKSDDAAMYKIQENTAFKWLLQFRPPVFASDDLLALASQGHYINKSPYWEQRYNATMVVPIRKNRIFDENDFELVGYLAVDTIIDTPGSDRVFCHGRRDGWREDMEDFLLGYADSMYAILTRAKVVGQKGLKIQMTPCIVNPDNFSFINELHREYLKRCRPGR